MAPWVCDVCFFVFCFFVHLPLNFVVINDDIAVAAGRSGFLGYWLVTVEQLWSRAVCAAGRTLVFLEDSTPIYLFGECCGWKSVVRRLLTICIAAVCSSAFRFVLVLVVLRCAVLGAISFLLAVLEVEFFVTLQDKDWDGGESASFSN